MFTRSLNLALAAATVASSGVAVADVVSTSADFDRWNYPFNGTPGSRSLAPVFGAVGTDGEFDDRDGEMLVGFNLASLLPALAPGQSLQINSVTVSATHFQGGFDYDPTYDSYATHLDTNDPDYVADADAGRPIVLNGIGFRYGYTGATTGFDFDASAPPFYSEGETFGFGVPTGEGVRTAHAASYVGGTLTDVSNNVTEGFDFTPFAVGTTSLNPGDAVVEAVVGTSPGSTFDFDVNLTDADILGYITDGIAAGELFFSITSLHGAAQQAGGQNPNFYTSENFDPAAIAPSLTIDYTVVPEPASLALLAGGLVAVTRRRRVA